MKWLIQLNTHLVPCPKADLHSSVCWLKRQVSCSSRRQIRIKSRTCKHCIKSRLQDKNRFAGAVSGKISLFRTGRQIKTASSELRDKAECSRLALIKQSSSFGAARAKSCCLNSNSCDCGARKKHRSIFTHAKNICQLHYEHLGAGTAPPHASPSCG